VIAFRRRKQPPALQVNSEMIEVPFNFGRKLKGLDQLDRRRPLAPGLDSK
jgi:hypothetical protein